MPSVTSRTSHGFFDSSSGSGGSRGLLAPTPLAGVVGADCPAALARCAAALAAVLLVSLAQAHDGPHGLPGVDPSLPPPSLADSTLRVYELGDTLEVRGRFDDLIGVASTSSEGTVGAADFRLRPLLREGELLETVPGLIQTQHSGDGKGNQMFLRGFNLDHGTDFATDVEGMPVNLPTHGHGHGYTDANFLIPELVERIDYKKGVFHPEVGDFGSSGGASVWLLRSLSQPFFRFEAGGDRFRRAVGGASQPLGPGVGLVGFEFKGYDGPWELSQDLKKTSGLVRYTQPWAGGTLSLLGLGYENEWNASDQIPARAVEDGSIGRFGQIDPTLGGSSNRLSLTASWQRERGESSLGARLYAISYDLELFSNFTYGLADPVNGDQLEQVDERVVVGGGVRYARPVRVLGRDHLLEVGAVNRNDFVDEVALYATRERERLSAIRQDEVVEISGGAHAALTTRWHPKFRSELGLRGDVYHFDVEDALLAANSGTESDAIVSPKASLVFGPDPRAEIYLSGGLGFHSNDARGTVISVDPATGDPADPVDPLVRSQGAEVGLRLSPIPGLRSTVSIWTLALDSELVYVGDGGGTEASDESRRVGVEWTNVYRPCDELSLDLDLAWNRARFPELPEGEDHVPGALESVVAAGATWDDPRGLFGTMRVRHFGAYALIEDDSVRADPTTLVNGSLGYRLGRARVVLSLLNVLDEEASDIQYYYESRLPGEPEEGVPDLHFHPVEPRQLRVSVGLGM